MITKEQAIEIVKNYILELDNDEKIKRCKTLIEKINSISEYQFDRIVINTLGENSGINEFNDWLNEKLKIRELQGTEFVELNGFVSYNLAGRNKETVALHLVPKEVTMKQIRDAGPFLVDALEQLKIQIQNGKISDKGSVFAVSDILKIRQIQKYFIELGFDVRKADEVFRPHYKDPYQANLSKDKLLSDKWEKLKDKFMQNKKTIKQIHEEDGLGLN